MAKKKGHPRTSTVTNVDTDHHIDVEDDQNGWHIWVRFTFPEGAPLISELRIHPDHGPSSPIVPPGGITTDVLRSKLSFTPLWNAVREEVPAQLAVAVRGLDPDQNF